ncbi:MAG: ferrous iron transport protein A [Sporomusaceae bacterium]|nr:ferrous iron transport protein A [Sporomusaceae bacterium]
MFLHEVESGSQAKVKKIIGTGPLQRRILDMGITPGTLVKVQKLAPLGDPLEVKAKGFNLSLRKAEASMIEVEAVS